MSCILGIEQSRNECRMCFPGAKNKTNGDRIRNMTDEELDVFLRKVKADYQWSDPEFPDVDDDWTEWLQSEVEE